MKKSHPDEDRIPTLRDLVFPGNQELRRSQSHERERIEPQLASDDEPEPEDASSPTLVDSYPADPFILLPDENGQDWEPAQAAEQAGDEPAESAWVIVPETEECDVYATDTAARFVEIEEQLPDRSTDDAMSPAPEHGDAGEADALDTAAADIPSGIEVEEEVSIEDLMTYFQRPKPQSKAIFEAIQIPAPAVPADTSPAPDPALDAETATEQQVEEAIRAAVRSTLEQEFDRLTDIVTDAVIARLRK